MTRGRSAVALAVAVTTLAASTACGSRTPLPPQSPATVAVATALPPPAIGPPGSLAEVLARRRSVRAFTPAPLATTQIGQLLWAAQGVTSPAGGRTAPSAGALYPLELYAATPGALLHYRPAGHAVEVWRPGDVRRELAAASSSQDTVAGAAVVVLVTGVPARQRTKYGGRAERYTTLEAGHATQNLLLQAVEFGLAAVPVGGFQDRQVARAAWLPAGQTPFYLVAVGHPAGP